MRQIVIDKKNQFLGRIYTPADTAVYFLFLSVNASPI